MCGTDHASRSMYAAALKAAGYSDVTETVLREYADELDERWVIGHLYSAIAQDQLPSPERRAAFEQTIREALGPYPTFTEQVVVSVLTGHVPSRPTRLRQ